jgi:DNA invertase Pin-like site-specific DNA recombinase
MCASSRANVGADKDSEKRQRATIEAYAKAKGIAIVAGHYDKAVRGSESSDCATASPACWLRFAANGVRTIIVESPDRFARDLAVQLGGHDHLKRLGVTLIPGSARPFHRGHGDRRAGAPGTRCHRAVREGVDRDQAEGCP